MQTSKGLIKGRDNKHKGKQTRCEKGRTSKSVRSERPNPPQQPTPHIPGHIPSMSIPDPEPHTKTDMKQVRGHAAERERGLLQRGTNTSTPTTSITTPVSASGGEARLSSSSSQRLRRRRESGPILLQQQYRQQ